METPSEDPTSTNEYMIENPLTKFQKPHHHLSKTRKAYFRSTHFRGTKYADIGFTIIKVNKKYVAHCRICNRTLGNTAYSRLKGHRNVCREAAPENELDSSLTLPSLNETYDTNLSQSCFSQPSSEQSNQTFNMMTPKLEPIDCQLNENILPAYNNSDHEREILNEENQLKLNMIEVLLPIKQNTKLLFEENTAKSMELWMKILKKAQFLNLAPTNVRWNYARDSLYSVWRHHTLEKRAAIASGDSSVKYNIVDLSILQIENSVVQNDNIFGVKNTNSIFTQTTDGMYEAELRLKQLQCEALEIENYKHCLEAFELERRLEVPHSKLTLKYIPSTTTKVVPSRQSNGVTLSDSSIIKIELDD